MPTYRVQPREGAPRTVQALRLRTDGEQVYSEDRVQRRLNEANGSWIWVTEHVRRMPR